MKVPFGTITIPQEAKDLIFKALDSQRVSSGKLTRQFEKQFAAILGLKAAVAVSSGTDADILALAVLHDFGARRHDEVIVPALSFVATGNAVVHAGFRPVFVDILRDTLNIDVSKIEAAITAKTKAIMPVHLMGKPADMDPIMALAQKYDLTVVEDAAEAHGALYKVLISLRSHGRACKCVECLLSVEQRYCPKRFDTPDGEDIRFIFDRIGYSSKMNELEAAVGLGNLLYYDDILNRRRQNLLYVLERFGQFAPYLATIKEESWERIGPHAIPIVVQEEASFSRSQFTNFLEKNGIETRTLFASMPTQCPGFAYLGYQKGQFPNAEYLGRQGLHIGVHHGLGLEEMEYVLTTIRRFLELNQR